MKADAFIMKGYTNKPKKGGSKGKKKMQPLKTKSKPGYIRCYESHPPLAIGEYTIYGGSCSHPVVTDADVYVGFDSSMRFRHGHYPWEESSNVVEFHYPITDMSAPKNPTEFHKLIQWLTDQLKEGKKVHIGCIGGHGRTGTVLAALVKHITGNKDAISYVREHYCKKAVESKVQVAFLNEHYGINKVGPTKDYSSPWKSGSKSSSSYYSGSTGSTKKEYVVAPMEHANIWGV